MLHFGSLLPPCRPPLLRILPLLPQSHQGIETLAKAQQLVIVSPPPCSLLTRTDHPISLMVQQTPAVAPLKFQQTPAVGPFKLLVQQTTAAVEPLKFQCSSPDPTLPVGSARRSFLPPTPIRRRKSLDLQSSISPPVSTCPLLSNPISTHPSLSCQYKLEESPHEQSNSNSFSSPSGSSCYPLQPPALGQFDWPTTLSFSSTQMLKKQEKEPKKGPNLERVAYVLSHDLLNIFLKSQEWEMYHPNMVLQDNIRGKRFEGLDQYMKIVNLLKLTAHIRFVYVRFHILKMTKHPEDGSIRIRWRIAGLGMVRMLVRYFPDKMWMKGNMDRAAPSWYDGISTFHVGGDDRIYKHTLDRLEGDDSPVVETLKEKLSKLTPAAAEPALGCSSQTL